ncbi:MAG TPA: substrate-binding domain-containing protein [Gemmatimonadales bacterium]|jgi:ABC-type phosphate transport system substrate-binding protein|nr:substrate-binding domain-containing protein [Gemmatimonadales bacterium]
MRTWSSLGRRRRTVIALLAMAAPPALFLTTPVSAQEAPVRVIVNGKNPVAALARDELSKLFLKKVAAWQTGEIVVPVDQAEDTEVRKVFSKRVLGKDVAAVKGYWQQAIFTGRSFPPVEKATDADVIAFVAANPNAIGYVTAAAELPATVKVLKVEP